MSADFNAKLDQYYKKMSKGQRMLADYIKANYDKSAFMTASKLGSCVGVSESTVVRFAGFMGYSGYPELQKELQEYIRGSLTAVQRMELTGELSEYEILQKVLKTDIDNIRETLIGIDTNAFAETVQKIISAKRVFVMGRRSAGPLAQIFGYYLGFMLGDVHIIGIGNDTYEQLIHIGENDVFMGISFPRYSNGTIEAMKFAKKRKAACIAITDSKLSPLVEIADLHMEIMCDTASFVDSLVAPLSVINALTAAISQKKKETLSLSLEQLEEIWNENHVYAGKK